MNDAGENPMITMSEANFNESLAQAWDAAIARAQQGVGVQNPYRSQS
jgi:hypothetical protein